MTDEAAWEELRAAMHEVELLDGIQGMLHWDQHTGMPAAASSLRGAHNALISRIRHARATAPRVGQLISRLEQADLDAQRAAGVRNHARSWRREARLPEQLVSDLAEAKATGFAAWSAARQAGEVDGFLPHLRHLVQLLRRKAEAIDANAHPYDVLLDVYDPGTTVASLRALFARLVPRLRELVQAIEARPAVEPLRDPFPVPGQAALSREVAATMGYEFAAGRLDLAVHPFTVNIGAGDVRITTRYVEEDLLTGLGSTIHEAGHALYEQGMRRDQPGWGLAQAASVGVHESQSRFWENAIGRSRPFCGWLAERIADHFPGTRMSVDRLYAASNRVSPSLIRVEADEVTYNLHVAIRFEIEVGLLEGRLEVDEVERHWNERYERYLGVRPPDPAQGVLQDVHWSTGAFGYFPSYTLGNLYATALLRTVEAKLPGLWEQAGRGELAAVRQWLRERIHARGAERLGEAAIRAVVGEQVDLVQTHMDYLWGRHGALYGATRS